MTVALARFRGFILCRLGVLLFPTALGAHPNGSSRIDIRLIDPDSITVTVGGKTDDFMNCVQTGLNYGADGEEKRRAMKEFQERVELYLQTRVRLQVDRRPLGLRVIRWKADGKGREDGLDGDSVAFWSPDHQYTLGTSLPSPRGFMDVEVQLFAEMGIEPIAQVSVFWKDTVLERKWLRVDRGFRFPLERDSLVVRLAQARNPRAAEGPKRESLFLRFLGEGFVHILPKGLDHILFVLGLFLFSTRMKPLLWQVTAFTVAHSITLGLSMAGAISLPARVVEPLIALSIAVVGIENIFFRKLKASRWLVVFCFGLVHGLGFAGALRVFDLPPGKFWVTLAGFNLGVECGQLAVIAAAFVLTRWCWNRAWYFKGLVVPASAAITAVALYWTLRRTLGI